MIAAGAVLAGTPDAWRQLLAGRALSNLDYWASSRQVADAVGSVEVLDLLHALTEADSIATGPAAWGPWKAELVRELVRLQIEHTALRNRFDEVAGRPRTRATAGEGGAAE